MCCDTVFLSNGHIDQFIISIWLNKVQAFLELGVEATTKTIALLGVSIRMMARILAQVIESQEFLLFSEKRLVIFLYNLEINF